MTLGEKLQRLRKQKGWSQVRAEYLACFGMDHLQMNWKKDVKN